MNKMNIAGYLNYTKKIVSNKLFVDSKKNASFDDLKPTLKNILSSCSSEESFSNFLNSSKELLKYSSDPVSLPLVISSNYFNLINDISKPQFLNYVSLTLDKRKEVLDNNFKIIIENEYNSRIISRLSQSSINRIYDKQATFKDILKFHSVAGKNLFVGFKPSSLNESYSKVVTYLNKFHSLSRFDFGDLSKKDRLIFSEFRFYFD